MKHHIEIDMPDTLVPLMRPLRQARMAYYLEHALAFLGRSKYITKASSDPEENVIVLARL